MQTNKIDNKRWAAERRIITIGFGVATAIWIVIAVLTYLNTIKAIQDNDWVTHTHIVLERLDGLLSVLKDAETGQRGYLITGDKLYLEPYNAAIASLPQQTSELRQLTADNPAQQQNLDVLEPLIATRLDRLRQGISLRDEKGFEAAQQFILTDQGKVTMDDIRTLVGQMTDAENELLRHRNDEFRASSQGAVISVSAGILVSFGLFAAIFYVLNRQIANRIRVEETLENERNLLRTLMDHLPDSVFVKDTESRFITNNVQHRRILGLLTLEEVVGKTDFDLFPRELAAQYFADEQQVVRTGQPVINREEPTIDKAGHNLWHLTTKVPLRDAQGQIVGMVGTSRDITERKQVEETLRYHASLVQGVSDAVISTDMSFNIKSWNKAAEALYGWQAEEVIGKPLSVGTEYIADRPEDVLREFSQKGFWRGEVIQRRKDSQPINILASVSSLKDDKGNPVGAISVNRDITERKRAEEEIKRLNDDLTRRAAALEAANKELESFSYSISHDLRAPLRAIDGFSRILLEEYAPQLTPDAVTYLQKVRNNAQRMGQLIDDLLAFSRLGRQPLKKQSVSLADLVHRVLDELRSEQDGRQVEISIGDLPLVHADPALLKQVVFNLLSNALKYTDRRDVSQIEIGCQQTNGASVYFVKDNGAGFDMQYVNKLFGVFQRLHSAQEYSGTGVGLAIVQRIVTRHGGRVWAEGKVDKGATFYFTLEEKHE